MRRKGRCSLSLIRIRRAGRAGVRAPIVATKPGNAGGAKGCRKMDANEEATGKDYEPVTVPFVAKPAGKPARDTRLGEPCVWTDRMLTRSKKECKEDDGIR